MSENLFGLTVAADKGLDDLQCQRLLSENRRYQEVMLQYCMQSMRSGVVPLLRTLRFPAGDTPDNATFFHWEHCSVYLKFTFTGEEKIKLLMTLVTMQKSGFCTRGE